MELRKILERRRMVRAYGPEQIDRATIERIVGTVRRLTSRLTQACKPVDDLVHWERWFTAS